MNTYTRTTKIEKIRNADGQWLRIGDLVSHYWDALSASRYFEGEIVDIARGRIAIQDRDEVLWVHANFIKDAEIVERAR